MPGRRGAGRVLVVMQWTRPSADRLSYTSMVQEVPPCNGCGTRIGRLVLTPVASTFMLWSSYTKTSNGDHHDRAPQSSQPTSHRQYRLSRQRLVLCQRWDQRFESIALSISCRHR